MRSEDRAERIVESPSAKSGTPDPVPDSSTHPAVPSASKCSCDSFTISSQRPLVKKYYLFLYYHLAGVLLLSLPGHRKL